MKLSNYRYNKFGGVDADRVLDGGEIAPYTLTSEEVSGIPKSIKISEYKKPPPSEQELKLSAFEFNGVTCSVCEADQNGWEVVGRRIETLLGRGEDYRSVPFFMENGNYVILSTHQEWLDFVESGWSAREALLSKRLSNG